MMKKLTWKLSYAVLLLAAAAIASAWAAPAFAAWEPTKPVEFIVPAGAGGASDQMARTIQGIILKH
jgi:putative tricarboxylic transport membrane protein